jgi:hypothetical protein
MGVSTVIALITSLLPAIVNNIPSLTAGIKSIVTDISSSISAIAGSGVITNTNPSTILVALQGVVVALQAEPNIPPAVLSLIGALDRAAQAALVADAQAQVKVDPTTLHPITPVP